MSIHVPQALSRHIIELDRSPQQRVRDDRRYIAVAGNIGSGKSSLVDFLHRRFALQPYFEPNEQNPYLADFYQDMSRWSFGSQVYFLTAKFKLHLELEESERHVIQDRTIWEDAEIFATSLHQQGLMSERDFATYRQLYETVRGQLRKPDLMLYLRCPVKTVRKRIALRGRDMEREIPNSYLRRLHDLYEDWIASYDLSPLVILPTDKMDYLTDIVDQHDILQILEKHLRE